MATTLNIKRKRGDTRRLTFIIRDSLGVLVDISSWTNFILTVDTNKEPEDVSTKVFSVGGLFVTDGVDARVRFTPLGTSQAGDYFYDAQALDSNSEKITFADGYYRLTQDITKD